MTDDTEEDSSNGKRRSDRDKAQVVPVCKDEELLEWFEALFYDEPEVAHFPERVEVHTLSGRYLQKYEKLIEQIVWTPQTTKKDGKQVLNERKPSKEKLLATTNKLIHKMQSECDNTGKTLVFGIFAWHFSRGDEPYSTISRRYSPRGRHVKDGTEEDMGPEKLFANQILGHQAQMVGMIGAAWEGITDRDNRTIEQLLARIKHLEEQLEKKSEQLERALSNEIDRDERRQWVAFKIKSAEKGLNLVEGIAPPLITKLVGNNAIPGQSPEAVALKNFFKTVEEGGMLTKEQADKAIGIWDETNQCISKPGVLSQGQSQILFQVAYGQAPPEELDKLLPGGILAVSMEQLARLQQIFPLEQIAPLMLIFQSRQNADKGEKS